jgi:tetratricopeptide (TPR) repeat protein
MIHAGARRQYDLDLSVSYGRLGQANYQLGNASAARDAYRKSLEISLQLTHADPENVDAQKASAYTLGVLGLIEKSVDEFAEAAKWLEQGVQLLESAEKTGLIAGQPIYLGWLEEQTQALESCRVALRAIGDLQFALGRSEIEIPGLLALRSRVLARRGQHFHAKATADLLAAIEPTSGENLYLAAEGYALCVSGMKPATPESLLSADDVALQERYVGRALELLNRAKDLGYFSAAERAMQLENDPKFDALRPREDFKELIDGLWVHDNDGEELGLNGTLEHAGVRCW